MSHFRVRENRPGFLQQILQNDIISRRVAGAEVGHQQRFNPGGKRHLRRHRGGGMEALKRHLRIDVGEGRLVYQNVCIPGELHCPLAENRIGTVNKFAADFRLAAEGRTVDNAAVLEGDNFSPFQLGVNGSGRNAQRLGFFHVETSGAILFFHPVAEGRDAVFQGAAADDIFVIFVNDAGLDGVDFDGVGKMGVGIADAGFDVPFQVGRTVDIDAGSISRQTATRQQPHQSKNVVAVHMGDKNTVELANSEFAAEKLMLGALATVEQPDFRPLAGTQGDAGDVARSRRDAGTGS